MNELTSTSIQGFGPRRESPGLKGKKTCLECGYRTPELESVDDCPQCGGRMIMEVGGIREAISRVDAGESAYDVLRNLGEVSQAEIKKSFGKEGLLRRAMGIKDRYKPVYKAGAQKLVAHAKKSTKQLRQVLRAMTGAWARRSEPKQGSEEYKVWSAVAKTMGWKFPPK